MTEEFNSSDHDFEISTDHLKNYLYQRLIDFNMIPAEEELAVLADVVFDLLVSLGALEEIFDEE